MPMARKRKNPWPDTLKRLREHYGLTQEEAAKRIDAPLGTWRNWEQGRNRLSPMMVRLIRLTFPEFFSR
jgi:DNA-binding transcriptional regulator YiaG